MDPYARLYCKTWSKHRQGRTVANRQGRTVANRYNKDKAESNPRASVGRRSANNIQRARQRDNPGERAIIQARYKQSPKGKAERIIQEHGQESEHRKSN